MSWFEFVANMHAMEIWSLEPEYNDRRNVSDNFVIYFTLKSATTSISFAPSELFLSWNFIKKLNKSF